MSKKLSVLGIDLASKRWRDNGSAILHFSPGDQAAWKGIEYDCVPWPAEELSPAAMAETIERVVKERQIAAVSLDGPQGWREPNAAKRDGVGRVCEYETRCQGKTGEYGKTYPQTQFGWISFCIEVFKELKARGNAVIVNDPSPQPRDPRPDGEYWLLECFPTSTWRTSNLIALPGKTRVGNNQSLVAQFANSLQQRYELTDSNTWRGSHDDLQAIVAALPAAGILNGPCLAVSNGKSGWQEKTPDGKSNHWVEGLIWDATLHDVDLNRNVDLPQTSEVIWKSSRTNKGTNPILVDDRADDAPELIGRGLRLFRYLANQVNSGDAVGVGYAQFVCCVHDIETFAQVANRPYAQADTAHVLRFAHQITEENGGPIPISYNGATISAGMDAFIWRKARPHRRALKAFENAGYSAEDWERIFPDGSRRLIHEAECKSHQFLEASEAKDE